MLTAKGQISAFSTEFEKFSRRTKSFAQTNFYGYLETMLPLFHDQKLDSFEGLSHGENALFSRSSFAELKCMPS